jgi:hypothetical protein
VAVLLAFTAGCGGQPAPGEERLRASQAIDFGDIASLGPHRMEASVARTDHAEGSSPRVRDEQTRVTWRGWDDFTLVRARDGEPSARFEIAGGRGQVLKPDGVMHEAADLEPLRLELRQAWNVWDPFLGPLRDAVAYTFQGQALIEGRLANQYTVSVAPRGADPVSRTVPDRIEGTLWIDEATGVRLMADVTTRWHRRGHDGETHEAHLILVRTDFGLQEGTSGS